MLSTAAYVAPRTHAVNHFKPGGDVVDPYLERSQQNAQSNIHRWWIYVNISTQYKTVVIKIRIIKDNRNVDQIHVFIGHKLNLHSMIPLYTTQPLYDHFWKELAGLHTRKTRTRTCDTSNKVTRLLPWLRVLKSELSTGIENQCKFVGLKVGSWLQGISLLHH